MAADGAGLALARLGVERKNWRKDHPHGFFARPKKMDNGELNMMIWECGIPGREGTPWEGGLYTLDLHFPPEYPGKPPRAAFAAGFFHVNVFPSGKFVDWKPAITVKQILMGIADLLVEPNAKDPAQEQAYHLFIGNKAEYERQVRAQAQRYKPRDETD